MKFAGGYKTDLYEFYVSLKCIAFVNRPAAAASSTISYIMAGGLCIF